MMNKNIIETKNLNEARKLIDKLKKEGKKAIVKAQDIDFNREILENKNVNTLILNHRLGKDKLKERNSGLNHILVKIARDNNITLAIDLSELQVETSKTKVFDGSQKSKISDDKKEKAEILARMLQNIKLIKKFKNKLIILNKNKDIRDIKSLFLILGLPTDMIKEI